MSDKLIALVTVAAVTPLCAFCILGPAALGSTLAWVVARFGGFNLWTTASASVGVAALIYGLLR